MSCYEERILSFSERWGISLSTEDSYLDIAVSLIRLRKLS
jgi:hypothetical protein